MFYLRQIATMAVHPTFGLLQGTTFERVESGDDQAQVVLNRLGL